MGALTIAFDITIVGALAKQYSGLSEHSTAEQGRTNGHPGIANGRREAQPRL
jgi:hypothetical protein